MAKKKIEYTMSTGRRKSATARIFLKNGEGLIVVNAKPYDVYFGRKTSQMIVRQPLEVTEKMGKFDIMVNVSGGGISAQAGAVRHGIARALEKVDAALRPPLKVAGLLTRDPREVERKKYGRRGARRSTQYSKR